MTNHKQPTPISTCRAASRLLFSVLMAVMIPAGALAATAAPPQPIVLPLGTYADTALKTISGEIGGHTIPFLFDTGGGLTLLTPEAAKTLGCQPFGKVTDFRADGEQISMQRCGPVTLRLGDYAVTGEVGVFDLMGLIRGQVERARKQGHDVPMPPTIGGLVGLSSFKDQAITLDYAHDRVIVETPASLRARVAQMHPINLRVATHASGGTDLFVQAKADTGTLWLQLDSGNNGPTGLAPHAIKQLGIVLPKGESKTINLNLVGLGEVPLKVIRRSMIYDGQLGSGLFRKLVLTIDLKRGLAWAAFAEPR